MKISKFVKDENASIPGNLLWFVTYACVAGIAVDTVNAFRVQNQLKVAADASALVAAAHIDDVNEAKKKAVELANLNLPSQLHGNPITEENVIIGVYDSDAGKFVPTDVEPNAVHVVASRVDGSAIQTFLMWVTGVNTLDVHSSSIAMALPAPVVGCNDATILTADFMNTGGRNTLNGSVCLHGEKGLLTGGDDFFSEEVRLSAKVLEDVTVSSVREGSATEEEIKAEQSLSPTIIPKLDEMFANVSAELVGKDGEIYDGEMLPSFLSDAKIVELEASYVVLKEPGTLKDWEKTNPGIVEVESNTIYVAPGSVTFEGRVDATGVGIIANGQIIVGGGADLHFSEVYFFAEQDINASGTIAWGDPYTYCETGQYNSYLFSKTALSLGGATGIYGVVGAAPRFDPGGGMESAGGVYFEAEQYTSLGGRYNVTGCGVALESEFELADPTFEAVNGSTALVY